MLRPRRRPGELILNGSISSSVSAAHRLFVFLTPGDPSSLVRRHWYNGNKLLRCNRRSFVFHASNEIKSPIFELAPRNFVTLNGLTMAQVRRAFAASMCSPILRSLIGRLG
jgi:hypothetical protein